MRHKLARDAFSASIAFDSGVTTAIRLESETQWFSAGEQYQQVSHLARSSGNFLDGAKALARAAHCFELVAQHRDAAQSYSGAASLLKTANTEPQTAGELFNRAAHCFKSASEFFNAGNSYRQAASSFAESIDNTVTTEDSIPPVPSQAGKYTVAGICFSAAGDAFAEGGELAWARSSYWESGTMHLRQGYGYHAYVSFRKALVMCIRFDNTLDKAKLRSALPFTEEERQAEVDPFVILEKAALSANTEHQQRNSGLLSVVWTRNTTDEQMISAYHEFYLELLKIGNVTEAGRFYVEEMRRRRRLYLRHGKYISAGAYLIWEFTSEYGESPRRWFSLSVAILLVFAILYWAFGLVAPATSWFDYVYFSIVTITTLGYGDIHPVNAMGKLAASAEVLCGVIMFGMLLNLLTRKLTR